MKKEAIRNHLRIMFAGFLRTLHGAATAGMFGLSVYGFVTIPAEGGYTAVCSFIAAIAAAFVALALMYALGAGKQKRSDAKKGRFAA
jgi:hypothetical protein